LIYLVNFKLLSVASGSVKRYVVTIELFNYLFIPLGSQKQHWKSA
jgi:hypothetical protein